MIIHVSSPTNHPLEEDVPFKKNILWKPPLVTTFPILGKCGYPSCDPGGKHLKSVQARGDGDDRETGMTGGVVGCQLLGVSSSPWGYRQQWMAYNSWKIPSFEIDENWGYKTIPQNLQVFS